MSWFRRLVPHRQGKKKRTKTTSQSSETLDQPTTSALSRTTEGGHTVGPALKTAHERPAYGFKVLAESSNPEVDIVAIHGVDGHRENSWTDTDEEGIERMWLRDYAPLQLRTARIVTYGYDATTYGRRELSQQTLMGHGQDLAVKLMYFRRQTDSTQRPLVFVAHGAGGVILKLALLEAFRSHEAHLSGLEDLKFSTYGIVFLGTPHQGPTQHVPLELDEVNRMWTWLRNGNGNAGTTREIDLDPHYLHDLMTMFTSITTAFDVKFVYETRAAVGATSLVVPRALGSVPGAVDTTSVGMNRDHAGLAQYTSTEDGDYQCLEAMLKDMTKHAPERIRGHWATKSLGENADIKTILRRMEEQLQLTTQAIPKTDLPLFNEGLPPPPLRILGREAELTTFLHILLNNPAPRVAILGPGGIGKTTIARQLLNDPAIIKKFPSTFFVSCDSVTSTTALLNAIADSLQLPADQRGQSLAVNVLQTLRSRKGCLLCLDNFEDPWDPPETRGDIEHLLESLGGLGRLGIVLTMRGSERPRGVDWNHPAPHPLEPLEDEPAVQLFYQVSGMAKDQRVSTLVEEVENIPLAIELLARQAELDGLDDVLKRWEKHGIKLMDRGDKSDKRLTSVTASIELSLHSPRIASILHIHTVARMLAELPNGLSKSMVADLQAQLGDDFDVAQCLRELIHATVIYLDAAGRYRILTPIRQHIISTIGWMSSSRDVLRSIYFQHINNHMGVDYQPVVAPEFSNIRHFVTTSERGWDNTHIEACLNYLWWENSLLGIHDINLALVALSHSNTPVLEVRCRTTISELLRSSFCFEEAERYIRPALSLKTGNLFWEGCVRMEMGDVLGNLHRYEEAGAFLREAVNLFKEADEPVYEADALQSLGTLFRAWGRFSDAEEPLKRSLELAKKKRNILLEGNALLELGKVYTSTARVSEAEDCLRGAITLYQQSHTSRNEALALSSLGDVLRHLGRVEEAEKSYLEALGLSRKIHNSVGEATALSELGVLLTQSETRWDSAERHFQDALVIFQRSERWDYQAFVQDELGDLFHLQRRFSEAITHFVLSILLQHHYLHRSKWERIVLLSAKINNVIEGMCLTNQ